MRSLAVVAVLALVALAFAGCANDPERYPNGVSSTPSKTASKSSTASGNSTSHVNHAPSANLTSTPKNGTAPLNVTLSLSGNDTDGDALAWTLAFGDGNSTNGTTLPTTVVHAYKGGNFTPSLTVSDGKANATANTTVTVLPGTVGFAPGMDPNCQRPDAVESGSYWIDYRGDDPVTAYATGGGDWLYEETNDIPGLQVSQTPGAIQHQAGDDSDVDPIAVQFNCQNGDTLQF